MIDKVANTGPMAGSERAANIPFRLRFNFPQPQIFYGPQFIITERGKIKMGAAVIKKKSAWNKSAKIRWALKKLWLWSPIRKDALGRARVGRGSYLCAKCQKLFGPKEIEVDHINQVSPPGSDPNDWNGFIERLFCEVDWLRILCKPCHLGVTNEQKTTAASANKARAGKAISS